MTDVEGGGVSSDGLIKLTVFGFGLWKYRAFGKKIENGTANGYTFKQIHAPKQITVGYGSDKVRSGQGDEFRYASLGCVINA